MRTSIPFRQCWNFYPRSPCGERPGIQRLVALLRQFLSTLSLRRATPATGILRFYPLFLSTLSLRRATIDIINNVINRIFLSTLSLRRATSALHNILELFPISIHALLAESDQQKKKSTRQVKHFYPRSPCGERLNEDRYGQPYWRFLSTLSLRRATNSRANHIKRNKISIHALLAESDTIPRGGHINKAHFYPRSPCGERQGWPAEAVPARHISIHALLAESDSKSAQNSGALLRI